MQNRHDDASAGKRGARLASLYDPRGGHVAGPASGSGASANRGMSFLDANVDVSAVSIFDFLPDAGAASAQAQAGNEAAEGAGNRQRSATVPSASAAGNAIAVPANPLADPRAFPRPALRMSNPHPLNNPSHAANTTSNTSVQSNASANADVYDMINELMNPASNTATANTAPGNTASTSAAMAIPSGDGDIGYGVSMPNLLTFLSHIPYPNGSTNGSTEEAAFLASLQAFTRLWNGVAMKSRGTVFPCTFAGGLLTLGAKRVKLFDLFRLVRHFGGLDAMDDRGSWKLIGARLRLTDSLLAVLRSQYIRCLYAYEQVMHFKREPESIARGMKQKFREAFMDRPSDDSLPSTLNSSTLNATSTTNTVNATMKTPPVRAANFHQASGSNVSTDVKPTMRALNIPSGDEASLKLEGDTARTVVHEDRKRERDSDGRLASSRKGSSNSTHSTGAAGNSTTGGTGNSTNSTSGTGNNNTTASNGWRRYVDTLGGYDFPRLGPVLASKSFRWIKEDLGHVNMQGVLLSLASGLAGETTRALNILAVLTSEPGLPVQDSQGTVRMRGLVHTPAFPSLVPLLSTVIYEESRAHCVLQDASRLRRSTCHGCIRDQGLGVYEWLYFLEAENRVALRGLVRWGHEIGGVDGDPPLQARDDFHRERMAAVSVVLRNISFDDGLLVMAGTQTGPGTGVVAELAGWAVRCLEDAIQSFDHFSSHHGSDSDSRSHSNRLSENQSSSSNRCDNPSSSSNRIGDIQSSSNGSGDDGFFVPSGEVFKNALLVLNNVAGYPCIPTALVGRVLCVLARCLHGLAARLEAFHGNSGYSGTGASAGAVTSSIASSGTSAPHSEAAGKSLNAIQLLALEALAKLVQYERHRSAAVSLFSERSYSSESGENTRNDTSAGAQVLRPMLEDLDGASRAFLALSQRLIPPSREALPPKWRYLESRDLVTWELVVISISGLVEIHDLSHSNFSTSSILEGSRVAVLWLMRHVYMGSGSKLLPPVYPTLMRLVKMLGEVAERWRRDPDQSTLAWTGSRGVAIGGVAEWMLVLEQVPAWDELMRALLRALLHHLSFLEDGS